MTETYGYDKTPTPPRDYDTSKVPAEIKKRATWVKTKFTGEDVAEAYAQGMEISGIYSDEAKKIAQQTKVRQDNLETQTAQSVAQMEADKDTIVANATVDSEVILARGGKATLGQRLDETTAQLAQKVDEVYFDTATNLIKFYASGELVDSISVTEATNSQEVQAYIDSLVTNGLIEGVTLADGVVAPYKTNFFELITEKNLFDGNYKTLNLLGASPFYARADEGSTGIVLPVKPNTTYSVIKHNSDRFKIGTDTILNRPFGETLLGSVAYNAPAGVNQYTFTTGPNDVVVYINTSSTGQKPLMQVVEGAQTEMTVSDYHFNPSNQLNVYSKEEIKNLEFTGEQMDFLKKDTRNLYDGQFIRKTMLGVGPFNLSASETSRTAKVSIKPNTTYSVIREETDRFKIATDTILNRPDGTALQGSIHQLITNSSTRYFTFTTDADDVVLYVDYTNMDNEAYIEIIEGAYSDFQIGQYIKYYPSDILNVYSKDEINNMISTVNDDGFDVFIFMGQSNMAGRGIQTPEHPETAPDSSDIAYEYRAVTNPNALVPLVEPFGVNEDRTPGINDGSMKTGSMVSSFAKSYHDVTGKKLIGISASKGATAIHLWQEGTELMDDLIERWNDFKNFAQENNVKIRNYYVVFNQGEGDASAVRDPELYEERLQSVVEYLKTQGMSKFFLVRIGYDDVQSTGFLPIIQKQTQMCQTHPDMVLVGTEFAQLSKNGYLKDGVHFVQQGYNLQGEQAGRNTAFYIQNQKEPTIYDSEFDELYVSHKH